MGRTLKCQEHQRYQKIVVALEEPMRWMQEIDAAIPLWPIA